MTKTIRFIAAASAVLVYTTSAPAAEISPELIAKAKQEGQVTYYTDLIVDQIVRPLTSAFETKYGIKVTFTRGDSQVNSLKLLNEYKAGRVMADVFGLTSGMEVLIEAGAVRPFSTANSDELPPQYRDPDRHWVSSHLFVMQPGINTSLVPAAQRPKAYADLLAPYWNDKMVWKPNDLSGGPGFIGNVLTHMGDERGMDYLRKLSAQKIKMVNASARAILDQVIAGEYPLALQIFNHHTVISAKKGAPVDWIKMEPVTGTLSVISVHKNAPHPNAAKLLVDFITSSEGQNIFRDAEYLPADPTVPALTPSLKPDEGGFRTHFFTPEQTEDNMVAWKKVYDDLFR
jgi:iron(III) transport system substrate-binding protein